MDRKWFCEEKEKREGNRILSRGMKPSCHRLPIPPLSVLWENTKYVDIRQETQNTTKRKQEEAGLDECWWGNTWQTQRHGKAHSNYSRPVPAATMLHSGPAVAHGALMAEGRTPSPSTPPSSATGCRACIAPTLWSHFMGSQGISSQALATEWAEKKEAKSRNEMKQAWDSPVTAITSCFSPCVDHCFFLCFALRRRTFFSPLLFSFLWKVYLQKQLTQLMGIALRLC